MSASRLILKVRPLLEGYERTYLQCKKCNRIYYHDFIPYSIGGGFAYLPCNHDFGYRNPYQVCKELTESDVLKTHNILIEE